MSVSLLGNTYISNLAHFAERLGLGSASLVGEILNNQNVKNYKSRYPESREQIQSSFELKKYDSTFSNEKIYDLARYYVHQSFQNLDGSKAFQIIKDVLSNAAFKKTINPTYSNTVGVMVKAKSTPAYQKPSYGFVSKVCNHYYTELLCFDTEVLQWNKVNVIKGDYQIPDDETVLFNLSLEQVSGLSSLIDERIMASIKKQDEVIEARRIKSENFKTLFSSVMPAGSKAVLVAEFHEDDCGHNDDYYGSKVKKRVVIGFSKHTRRLFSEMRKAALNYAPTKFLNDTSDKSEHRENYSMGRGSFLTEGSTYSGWLIKKEVIYNGAISEPAELLESGYGNLTTADEKPSNKKIHKAITTLQSMPQKKASLLELSRATIAIDPDIDTVTLKTKLSVNNRQSRELLAGGFNFDRKNNEWSAKMTQAAVEAARKVGTTEMCGIF